MVESGLLPCAFPVQTTAFGQMYCFWIIWLYCSYGIFFSFHLWESWKTLLLVPRPLMEKCYCSQLRNSFLEVKEKYINCFMRISIHLDRMSPMILGLWKQLWMSFQARPVLGGKLHGHYFDDGPPYALTHQISGAGSKQSISVADISWLQDCWLCVRLSFPLGHPLTGVSCLLLMGISTSPPTWPTNFISFLSPECTTVEAFSYFPVVGKLDGLSGDLIPLGIPLPPCLPGTLGFICMASGISDCGGTCFIADTKTQAPTSHTFSYNISSAGGIHLFVITGCIQYHCTRPFVMAQRHEKTH